MVEMTTSNNLHKKGGKKKKWQIKETRGDKIFLFFVYLYLIGALVITLYPLIFIMSASISEPHYVATGELTLLPRGVNFESYQMIFANSDLWLGYRNTIFYTLLGTTINLIVTIPAAYALSRPEFYGKKLFTTFMIITMFFGGGMIPTFILVNNTLNLGGTIWALLLPGATSVFNIIISRTFFQSTIPREMEEAAIVDGCSDFAMFIKIILPLSMPIIAVMALFFGVGHWNSWFSALLYIPMNRGLWPLQMFLRELLVQQDMFSMPEFMDGDAAMIAHRRAQIAQILRYGVMIVSTLPIILVYPFLQKYFVKGVMVGSLKG